MVTAIVNDSEIKSLLKIRPLSRVYYFYGKDIANAETAAKETAGAAVKKGGETYNYHAFDGKSFSLEELVSACEALPMGSEYVCCTVCDLNAETLGADTLKELVNYISDLPETTVLVFYNTSVDVTDGKKYPTAKNKKLIDAATKYGTVCCFSFKTPAVLAREICAKAAAHGSSISRDNAALVAELCGCSTILIDNEIAKLSSYAQNNEITAEDIRLLCPRQIDATSFDLAKAIARHDKINAFRLLADLAEEKTEPIAILYAVSGNMVDLYRAKAAQGCRKTAADVLNDFGYAKNLAFRVDNAFREAGHFSIAHLRKCVQILTETDVAMKSSAADKMILLEEAIVKMLASE